MTRQEYHAVQGAYPSDRPSPPDPFLNHLRAIVAAQKEPAMNTTATDIEARANANILKLTPDDRDAAAEARHGGRLVTFYLAKMAAGIETGSYGSHLKDIIWRPANGVGPKPSPESLTQLWAFALSPSGSTGSGRDTTASLAQSYAREGGDAMYDKRYLREPSVTLKQAEAMLDWPIYRAARTAQVYVNYSGEDGGLDVTVTRGEAEVIEQDWDGVNGPALVEDYERGDLVAMREKLSAVAQPDYRDRLLRDMDEVIERFDAIEEETR